jgi:DNA-binding transcriptional MerR regulator
MTELLLPAPPVAAPAGGLTIGQAAAACGLSVDTLRYYEREGLTLSATSRSSTGHRRYGDRDLAWLAGLVMLRATGMSISEIREIAALSRRPGTEGERLAVLGRHRERVLERLAQTQGHLAAIDTKIAAYRQATGHPATP